MPTYGPFNPTTIAQEARSLLWEVGWPHLGTPAIDGNYSDTATAGLANPPAPTSYLKFGGFGVSVLATETYTRISLTIVGDMASGTSVDFFVDVINGSGTRFAGPVSAGGSNGPNTVVDILGTFSAADLNSGITVRIWGTLNPGGDAECDGVRIDAITGTPVQVTKDLALSGVVATGKVSRDVTLSAVVKRDTSADVTLTAVVGLALEITNPGEGDTVTSAAITFQWGLNPGPQSDYRLRIYTDAGLTELVYDSGVVGSALQQHTVPAGALPSPDTLYANVRVTTTGQATGTSPTRTFTTSFATSVNVTGVDSRLIGGCAAPTLLPGIRISWTQVAPGAGESFVSYDIRRRESGETLYTRIAQILAIGTTHYDDYQVESRTAYEYMVVWQAQNGASTLISNNQSAPEVALNDFEFNWLHDPDDGFGVRIDGWAQNVALDPDVRFVQPWGRTVPTAHWGTAFAHKFNLTLHPQLLKDRDFWRDLETLMSRKTALCLRFGRAGERYFVAIGRGQKQQAQVQFEPSIELTEIHYDEAV